MKRTPRAPWTLAAAIAVALLGCIRKGAETPELVYRRYCASCHGVDGRGDGPAAAALDPRPTDLTRLTYGIDDLVLRIDGTKTIRAHGDRSMPVWGEIFAAEVAGADAAIWRARLRVDAAATYARSLQRPAP